MRTRESRDTLARDLYLISNLFWFYSLLHLIIKFRYACGSCRRGKTIGNEAVGGGFVVGAGGERKEVALE